MSSRNGLQAERTAMAWQRTALGLGAVSALLFHHADGDVAASAPGAVGMVAALAVLVLAETRHHRQDGAQRQNAPMGAGAVRAMAAVTVLLSLAAAIVLLHGGQ